MASTSNPTSNSGDLYSIVMASTSTAAASTSGFKTISSFKKKLTKTEVNEHNKFRWYFKKDDFDNHIIPHLKPEEVEILEKCDKEEPLNIPVVNNNHGPTFTMELLKVPLETSFRYHLIGTSPLVIYKKLREGQEAEISYRQFDGRVALNISH